VTDRQTERERQRERQRERGRERREGVGGKMQNWIQESHMEERERKGQSVEIVRHRE